MYGISPQKGEKGRYLRLDGSSSVVKPRRFSKPTRFCAVEVLGCWHKSGMIYFAKPKDCNICRNEIEPTHTTPAESHQWLSFFDSHLTSSRSAQLFSCIGSFFDLSPLSRVRDLSPRGRERQVFTFRWKFVSS